MKKYKSLMYKIFFLTSVVFCSFTYGQNWLQASNCNTILCQNKEKIVYITKTGKKYHRENCRFLRYSKIPISREKAMSIGYGSCKICKP